MECRGVTYVVRFFAASRLVGQDQINHLSQRTRSAGSLVGRTCSIQNCTENGMCNCVIFTSMGINNRIINVARCVPTSVEIYLSLSRCQYNGKNYVFYNDTK